MKKVSMLMRFTFLVYLIALMIFCSESPKSNSIKNIETFGRLYGYIRYFYPGDEAAKIDWNRFVTYGVKKVENAKNQTELKQILEELFLPIVPSLSIYKTGSPSEFSPASITPPDTKNMKIISWQHQGVGFGKHDSKYKSIRLNRENIFTGENNYGLVSSFIDVRQYRNNEFKFKAAVKVTEGIGHLWLRVNRENNLRGFADNMMDRPIKNNEWKEYEIDGVLDSDAEKIYFGGMLRGTGKILIDDFQFYVKTQNNWEPVKLPNSDFEEDKEGDLPAKWTNTTPTYKVNVTSETAKNGKKSMSIESENQIFTGELFEKKAAFGEIVSKEFGSGLSCTFPLALYGTDNYTYPQAQIEKFNSLTTAIEKEVPKDLSGNDRYLRLGDVVITWNIFHHFYPYFDVVKTDWKAAYKEALESASTDKTDRDFLLTMRKLIAALKDGHGSAGMIGKSGKESILPMICEWIEGKPVIVKVIDKNLTNVQVGDILKEIAGKNAIEKLENEKQYISAATEGWLMFSALNRMLITPDESDTMVTVEREGGEVIKTTIKPMPLLNFYKFCYSNDNVFPKKLKDGIYYIDISSVPMDEINRVMPDLEKAKAIICDLRGYPKSNHEFISHLLKEKDTSTAWMKFPLIIYPDFEKVTYKESGWEMEPLKPLLTAKIIFIIDGRAVSYAESYMGFIEHYKLATIVGQPTAGTNGNLNSFILPGGYYVTFTGMRVVKHDGSQHHGVGIIPNVRVERTIKGVREGKDEYLEKALELAEE